MANKFVTALFGDYSKKEVKRVMPLVEKINVLEDSMKKLTDASMKAMQKNPSDAVKIQALLKDLTDVIKM